jgi:hypothetical protein
LKFLESRNEVFSFKIKQANRIGIPDIFFTTVKTGPWFVEIKLENEKPLIHQYAIIDKLNKCGMRATWISGWDGWIAFVKKIGLLE